MDITNLVEVGAGVAGGAVSAAWLTKFLVTRYIEHNDAKHRDNTGTVTKLNELLSEVKIDLEVLKSHIADVKAFRDVVREHEKSLAVQNQVLKDLCKDIDAGFSGFRSKFSSIENRLNKED